MKEEEIYLKVLDRLFKGLKIEKHEKFKNDRLGERKFAINDLYPDIIMTKKNSDEVDFIIEIVIPSYVNKDTLFKKWKPLSQVGSTLYLVVPKAQHKVIEKWCNEEKAEARFGTYEFKNENVELKFF